MAAAHAADGLQALLEVIGAGQNIEAADVDALGGQLRDAHQSLTNAVTNVQAVLKRRPATINNALAAIDDLYIRRHLPEFRSAARRHIWATPHLPDGGSEAST